MADNATDPASPLALRSPWPDGFPAVAIHATESSVKKHPEYAAAKAGNAAASLALVMAVADNRLVLGLDSYRDKSPLIVPVQGLEGVSLNTIPLALGVSLATRLGYGLATSVVQSTKAGHTGATGWWRLRSPALFSGDVEAGRNCAYNHRPFNHSEQNMGHLSRGGEPSSAMASMPLPNPKPSTYYAPKMLTPSEEDWLRQQVKAKTEEMLRILAGVKQAA